MQKHDCVWVFVADGRAARLLECSRTEHARCHVEERDSLAHEDEGHEHRRPSPLASKAGHAYASTGHESEEDLQRFAKQVGQWIGRHITKAEGIPMTLIAPARFLGAFRKNKPSQINGSLVEHEAELAHIDTGALSQHPTILKLTGLAD